MYRASILKECSGSLVGSLCILGSGISFCTYSVLLVYGISYYFDLLYMNFVPRAGVWVFLSLGINKGSSMYVISFVFACFLIHSGHMSDCWCVISWSLLRWSLRFYKVTWLRGSYSQVLMGWNLNLAYYFRNHRSVNCNSAQLHFQIAFIFGV